jgi:hypothetical protein
MKVFFSNCWVFLKQHKYIIYSVSNNLSSLTDRFTPFKATPSKDCSCITIVYLFTFLS